MNNNELNTEKLIQYLDGDLTGSELLHLKQELSKSVELQRELENLELAKKAIRSYGLKNQVASVHQEMMHDRAFDQAPAEAKVYSFFRSTLKYAASIILVLFAAGIYVYVSTTPAKLYNENYQPYQLSVARGEASASQMEKAFNSVDYTGVVSAFTKLKAPGNKENFLAGQAYLALHQPFNAIPAFRQALGSPGTNSTFKDDAEYYLGLAYLENNQPAKAEPLFEKIHNDQDHLYHDKVSEWTLLKLKLVMLKGDK